MPVLNKFLQIYDLLSQGLNFRQLQISVIKNFVTVFCLQITNLESEQQTTTTNLISPCQGEIKFWWLNWSCRMSSFYEP